MKTKRKEKEKKKRKEKKRKEAKRKRLCLESSSGPSTHRATWKTQKIICRNFIIKTFEPY